MSLNTNEISVGISASVKGTDQVANLTKTLQATSASVDDLAKQQSKMAATLNTVAKQFDQERIAVSAANAEHKKIAESANVGSASLKKMGEEGGKAMEHVGFHTVGAKRELLVLLHEMSQGSWKQFGGSLLVLGERTNVMSAIFSSTGLAIGAVAVALGGVAFAMIKGALESEEFSHAMQLTGNYAGITEGQFNSLAKTVGNSVPGQFGHAREAMMELAKSGQITGAQMAMFGTAVLTISKLSGESTDKVAQDFVKMRDGVTKWAVEHNKQYNYLTLDQYTHIRALEEEGRVTEAMTYNVKALDDAKKGLATHMGYLESAANKVGDAFSRMWDSMKSWGRDETVDDAIARKQQALDKIRDQLSKITGGGKPSEWLAKSSGLTDAENDLAISKKKKAFDEAKLAADALAAADNKAAITARERIDSWDRQHDQIKRFNLAVREYKADVEAINKLKPGTISDSDVSSRIALMRKEMLHDNVRAENELNRLIKDSKDRTIALQREAAQYDEYGKKIDKSREAIAKWNLAHDPQTMRDAKQQPELAKKYLQTSLEEDVEQRKVSAAASIALIDKRISTIHELNSVTEHNKVAREEAIEIDKIEQERALIGNAIADQKIAKMKEEMAIARVRKQRDAEFQEQSRADKEIAVIQAQIESLGKTNEERIKAVSLAKELEAAEKRIKEFALEGADAEAARTKAAAKGAEINAKQDELYQKSRGLEVGAKSFFEDYNEQVTNSAASIKKALTGAFKASEDAMVEFVTTGKLNFTSFADTVIKDLIRMALQRTILLPVANGLQGAMGGWFGGGGVTSQTTVNEFGNIVAAVPHANGGVFGPNGSIPLNKYANGGIANSPQLAMFGEGRHPEAYVPLPDGRSIPVSMKGGSGSNMVNNISVTVNSDGSSTVSPQQSGAGFARAIQSAVRAEMLNQRRDGGMLSTSPAGV
jgi:lambda family phage tail tape measure protein